MCYAVLSKLMQRVELVNGDSGKKDRNVLFLGLVSFFTDLSTKMVYPLVPLYLTAVFGVTPTLIGVIEGIVDSLASTLKIISGRIGDRFQKKKLLAFSGYSTGVLYKILLAFAGSWGGVLFAKIVDRFGKGIRTTPRDVLIAESSGKKSLGKSFGLQKMLDKAGSALGILIVYFLMVGGVEDFRNIFLVSAIPAVIGLCMFFFVKERKVEQPVKAKKHIPFFASLKTLDGRLKLYLLVVLLFTLGSFSNVFMLLRAQSLGFSDTSVILLFFAFTVSASVLALPLGKLSDRAGRKALLVTGYLVLAAVYLGFAFAANQPLIIGMFLLFSAYTAIISGTERAFVAEIAPPELKGTVLGLKSTIAGIALLPANILAGVLWDTVSPAAPFAFGAVLSLAAAVVLLKFLKSPRHSNFEIKKQQRSKKLIQSPMGDENANNGRNEKGSKRDKLRRIFLQAVRSG